MSDTPTEQYTHPDELLPWFVTGTLPDDERHDVEQHLKSCARCQREISLLQQMRTQVKEAPTESPGEFGLNRLLNEVRNEHAVTDVRRQTQSGWWRTGLAIAASLIIFVQAGLLIDAWFLSKPMEPLAGPQLHGPILQIAFVPTATESQIREVITGVHATFIDGPSHLGIYRIRLDLVSPDHQKLDHTMEQLRQQKTIIRHVAQD